MQSGEKKNPTETINIADFLNTCPENKLTSSIIIRWNGARFCCERLT